MNPEVRILIPVLLAMLAAACLAAALVAAAVAASCEGERRGGVVSVVVWAFLGVFAFAGGAFVAAATLFS